MDYLSPLFTQLLDEDYSRKLIRYFHSYEAFGVRRNAQVTENVGANMYIDDALEEEGPDPIESLKLFWTMMLGWGTCYNFSIRENFVQKPFEEDMAETIGSRFGEFYAHFESTMTFYNKLVTTAENLFNGTSIEDIFLIEDNISALLLALFPNSSDGDEFIFDRVSCFTFEYEINYDATQLEEQYYETCGVLIAEEVASAYSQALSRFWTNTLDKVYQSQ